MLEDRTDRSQFLRRSALTAAAGLTGASAGALGRAPRAEAATARRAAAELSLWAYTGGAYTKTHELAAKRFERKYGGDVTVAHINDGSYLTKLKTAIAGGVPPDVGALQLDSTLREIVRSGAVVPLDSYLKTGFPQFYPAALKASRVNGKVYGIPTDVNTLHIAYNKEIFKELGLKVPTTQAEFIALLGRVRRAGLQGLAGTISGDLFFAQLVYTDPSAAALGDADAGRIRWTDRRFLAAAQALERYVDGGLFADNAATTAFPDLLPLMQAGKIAFLWSTGNFTDAILPKLFRFQMGEMPFPALRRGQALRTIGGPAEIFAVFSASKDRAAAVNLMRMLTDITGRTELVAKNFIPSAPTSLFANKSALYKYYLRFQKTAGPRLIFNTNVAQACDAAVVDMVRGKINARGFVNALQDAA